MLRFRATPKKGGIANPNPLPNQTPIHLNDNDNDYNNNNDDKKYSTIQSIRNKISYYWHSLLQWFVGGRTMTMRHPTLIRFNSLVMVILVVVMVVFVFGSGVGVGFEFEPSSLFVRRGRGRISFVRIVHLEKEEQSTKSVQTQTTHYKNNDTAKITQMMNIQSQSQSRSNSQSVRKVKPMSSGKHLRTSRSYDYMHEEFETEDCKAMTDWQTSSRPTCNIIHQIDLSHFFFDEDGNNKTFKPTGALTPENRLLEQVRFLANGGFRGVWKIQQPSTFHDEDNNDNDNERAFVLKTLVQGTDHTYRHYNRHRRDALTTSLLQSSIHIPNIYGYCSNAGLFDYAREGDLESAVFHETWTPIEKLRYAWQVSVALAHVHGVENGGHGDGVVAVSHTDISLGQFLWMDGMYKLNDFNRARFIRWNAKEEKSCPFEISKSPGKHRSPEEYNEDPLTEKIDVFSLGNILLAILRQKRIYSKDEKTEDVQKRVADGIFPTANISAVELSSYDPMEMAILEAIQMCWVLDKEERSSAAQVELFLRDKLKNEFHLELYDTQ